MFGKCRNRYVSFTFISVVTCPSTTHGDSIMSMRLTLEFVFLNNIPSPLVLLFVSYMI